MSAISIEQVPERELMPGFHGRLVHSESMTLAYWRIEEAASLPEHRHPHEQVVNMLEGELELVMAGVAHRLRAGDVLVIPSDVPHSARGITDCRVLDVFHPVREDYR